MKEKVENFEIEQTKSSDDMTWEKFVIATRELLIRHIKNVIAAENASLKKKETKIKPK